MITCQIIGDAKIVREIYICLIDSITIFITQRNGELSCDIGIKWINIAITFVFNANQPVVKAKHIGRIVQRHG